MTNRTSLSDAPEFIPRDEIDEMFAYGNPNPARTGCPPQADLAALVRRERPITDPIYDHLGECSPCYRQARAIQQAGARHGAGKWLNRWAWVAAAAVLVAVAGSAWFYVWLTSTPMQPMQTTSPAVARAGRLVELDLRPYRVSRSSQDQVERPPLVLPKGLLDLTVLLPVGSEPGAYDLEVMDAASHVIGSASGNAVIRNFNTTLEVTIDLQRAESKPLQLSIRRVGEDWRLFPATVK